MSDELISKKELLEQTGITYGQLYRWKRKQLIPEEWFIKKSSFTGQETYFPKDRILDRISKILDLKEAQSLDELAETFSPSIKAMVMSRGQVLESQLIQRDVLNLFVGELGESLDFPELLALIICQEYLLAGTLSVEEGIRLIKFLREQLPKLPEKLFNLMYLRRLGMGFWVLLESDAPWMVEHETKTLLNIGLQPFMEQLKTHCI